MTSHAFSPDIVTAVLTHMNGDHPEDSLVIVRAFARPDAEAATMIGLDGDGGVWAATSTDGESEVRVQWSRPITERAEIRREVVVLYNRACDALGIPRRAH
ncbi:hypothetical protein GCM10027416_31150 [Okibacterium endophyticum]